MGLVEDKEVIFGKKIKERVRSRARRATGEMPRVIFNAVAESHLLHHLEIELRSHANALGLDKFALALKLCDSRFQLAPDASHRGSELVVRGDELLGRKKSECRKRGAGMSRQGVKHADPVDFIAKKLHPHSLVIILRRVNLHHIPTNPEFSSTKGDIISLVEHLNNFFQEFLTADALAGLDRDKHLEIIFWRRETIDTRNAGHDNRVPARQQRTHGREPEALDLFIDRGVFFDVSVRAGDVGLRLVVVEVTHKILDRIVWEELLEFAVELRGERLVVRHDERRPPQILNHIRNSECLARSRDTKERLVKIPCGK